MGTRAMSPWPLYSEEEQAAVAGVLASGKVNYWTGTLGREFEAEFARFAGSAHAIAVANGTVALDLALHALGIGPGDEVIVTPRSFIASVSSIVNARATPRFADIELDSGNISARTIAPLITPRTKAIIPVHLGGWPCDMPLIMELAEAHGLFVIEDCAQAHGATIGGKPVGSFGHIGAWSFCQDKIMTTGGEGGMVTTNDPLLWKRMWSFKDHGKDFDAIYNQIHAPGFRWVHRSFGTNWRMLEMQAAIGLIQLRRMADWTEKRTANAMIQHEALAEFSDLVRSPLPAPADHFTHAFYRHYAYVRTDALRDGWDRDRIVAEIAATGAPIMHGSCSEIYLEAAFDGTDFKPENRLPNARELGETSLMFYTHPTLGGDEVRQTADAIRQILQSARHPGLAANAAKKA